MYSGEQIPQQERFLTQYQPSLEDLFDALGIHEHWTTDPAALVAYTQQWVKGDHSTPKFRIGLDDIQRTQSIDRFRELAMVDETVPTGGEYDQLVILGGLMSTNDRRTKFGASQLERSVDPVRLAEDGQIVFWSGPRTRQESERAAARQLLALTAPVSQDPWLSSQLERPETEQIRDEVAGGRLSLLAHLGDAAMSGQRTYLRELSQGGEHLWLPTISHHGFGSTHPGGKDKIVVMNALPVSRSSIDGDPRHTTVSCAQEWLERYAPSRDGATVLFVTSNPYIRRTTAEVRQVISQAGAHIEVVGCGPAAPEDVPVELFLGEIARTLYFEEKSAA